MVNALCKEIFLRSDFFDAGTVLDTIYLGGGTPSVLSIGQLQQITRAIHDHFSVHPHAEVTLEANPDDLNQEYLSALKEKTIVNRISIGIQTFNDDALTWMNRSHNARQAYDAILYARQAGFENITADLIYGLPAPYHTALESDLQLLINLQIPHFSCYGLTTEPRTALAYQIRNKIIHPLQEDLVSDQYLYISNTVRNAGYRVYEISNIARPGFEAVHNSNYWKGDPYLGIGPSAHSYNPFERSWNISHNLHYIESINSGVIPFEKELLSPTDRYNEYIMTGLRLETGISINRLKDTFGKTYSTYLLQQLKDIDPQYYILNPDSLQLTDTGRLWCDKISGALFMTD
jgi:oxygen-independent coproporphyrinogen-3 oxidase